MPGRILLVPIAAILTLAGAASASAEVDFDRLMNACNGDRSGSRSCVAECRAIERRGELGELTGVADKWCNYALRTNEVGSMASDKACGPKTCVYRLTRSGEVWRGAGYTIRVRPAPAGRDYVIRDPAGRTTTYSQCGTCRGLDYERGPLRGVSIDNTERGLVLSVPRGR